MVGGQFTKQGQYLSTQGLVSITLTDSDVVPEVYFHDVSRVYMHFCSAIDPSVTDLVSVWLLPTPDSRMDSALGRKT